MDPRTRAIAIAGSIVVLVFVVELVRRRRMKEEYSILWIATALVLLLLSAWDGLLDDVTETIGAAAATSTLLFFGLGFVMLMLLHFSVRVSQLERQLTALVQEIALLREEPPHPPALEEDLTERVGPM